MVLGRNVFSVDQPLGALAGTRTNDLSSVQVSGLGQYAALRDGSLTHRLQVRMVGESGFEPPAPAPRMALTGRKPAGPLRGTGQFKLPPDDCSLQPVPVRRRRGPFPATSRIATPARKQAEASRALGWGAAGDLPGDNSSRGCADPEFRSRSAETL